MDEYQPMVFYVKTEGLQHASSKYTGGVIVNTT